MKYKIMGAGPAGLSAAIKLARDGYNVEIFEQTTTIGGHTGNNIQAIRNYGSDKDILGRFKKEGLELKHFKSIFNIVKYSPSHKSDTIYSDNIPLFYTIKRGIEHDSLENQLAEQARNLGVEINLGKKVKIVDVHIVGGGSKFDPVGMGYGGVFENSEFDEETILFFMGNKYAPHGYAYLVPYGKDQVTIALTTFVKSDFHSMENYFNHFIKYDPVIEKILKDAKLINRFSGYGHYNLPKSAIYKHKYFVGGAAGFVDPARGFGIKYAILSGILAAKAIVTSEDYDKLWQNEFKEELYEGFSRRVLLSKLSPKHYEKIIKGQKIPVSSYEKVPPSLKELMISINGKLSLDSWRKKFPFSDIFLI